MKLGIEEVSPESLESKIRDLARRLFAGEPMGDLEAWYLAQVVEHCSRRISDIYRTVNLDQVLRGTIRRPGTLDRLMVGESRRDGPPIGRVARAPDALRGLGDRCLYDVSMVGVRDYQGVSLETLGVRSYRMAADVLSILANERDLRELFQRNRVRTLPIEEEIDFLRQCATRFGLHAQLLQTLREERLPTAVTTPGKIDGSPDPAHAGGGPAFSQPPETGSESEPTDRLLLRHERALLWSDTDFEEVRRRLRWEVIGQDAAVDGLCDDLLLHASGIQDRGLLPSYLLAGPAGVGKKRLMRSLARILEEQWEVEVPIHLLEGSRPGRPDEAGEPGGLLDEFLRRASRRPVSILIVDSVEEAHPRLQQLCLTLLQRGTLHDDRGRSLRLDGGLVAFTARAGSGSATESEAPGRRRGKPREGDSPAGGAFRPEIRSRLQVLQFSPLSRRSKSALLEREVWPIFERFRSQQGVEMVLTDRARARLLKLGFSEARGAMDLAATVWRHCALEVTRRLLRDRSSRRDARKETVRDLRKIRAGGRPFDPAAWEQRVRRLARIPVPYRRMIIDERDGEFRYSGQESR